ncbi:MAG: hypothetical protein ACR2KJ_14235 [Jatrophihabitans sp.]
MTATSGDLPVGPGWAFEVVWGGARTTLEIRDGGLIVRDGAGQDVTALYPEFAVQADGVEDAVLDGEVIGADGHPVDHPQDPDRREVPAVFLLVDVLRLYGVDLVDRPFVERRATLQRLAEAHPSWTLPPAFDDAAATLAAAHEHGLAGVVAKRLDSRYRPGSASPDWVFCKLPAPPVKEEPTPWQTR